MVIFVAGVIEDGDIRDAVKCIDIRMAFFGRPVTSFRKNVGMGWVFKIKIVVAEDGENWSDCCEIFEPSKETI